VEPELQTEGSRQHTILGAAPFRYRPSRFMKRDLQVDAATEILTVSNPFASTSHAHCSRIHPADFMTEGTGATPSLAGSSALAEFLRSGKFNFQYVEVDGNHGSMVPMVWPGVFDLFHSESHASSAWRQACNPRPQWRHREAKSTCGRARHPARKDGRSTRQPRASE
jgi:hypothetical protein